MGVNWSDALFLASVVREMLQGQRHQQDHQLNFNHVAFHERHVSY